MEKRLLTELFQPVEKSLIVIAGANGSGKSTLVVELELKFDFAHLDPDRVAKTAGAQAAVGREAILLRDGLFKKNRTFGLETTLSGKGIERFLKQCKNAGYRIVIVYVWLDNPQVCIERIGVRVAMGEHDIDDEIVKRRFFRSNFNFWTKYKLIADQWFLFYNGHNEAKLAASGAKDVYDVHSKQLFIRYRGLIDECNSKLDNKRTK